MSNALATAKRYNQIRFVFSASFFSRWLASHLVSPMSRGYVGPRRHAFGASVALQILPPKSYARNHLPFHHPAFSRGPGHIKTSTLRL